MPSAAALIGTLLATGATSAEGSGPNFISAGAVGLGACLVLVNAVVSLYLALGLELQLVIATVRCIAQLTILGFILVPIFTSSRWYVVICYCFVMALVGAWEAASRPAYSFQGMFAEVLGCTVLTSSVFVTYALLIVVRTSPWWEAQYLIPMLGMLLGNCISSISVGLSSLLEEVATSRDRIELLLSLGATRWEASKEMVARCVRLALTPILNQMNVVGIVSIPGMMTGQILGGSDPSQAARYQMVIMFLISATSGVGATLTILLATASVLDAEHRLRPERLLKQTRGRKFEHRLEAALSWVGGCVSGAWKRLRGVRPAGSSSGGDEPSTQPLLPS